MKTYTKQQVINEVRYYCDLQRGLCELAIGGSHYYSSKEFHSHLCKKVRIDADIDKFRDLDKEIK